MKFIEANLSLVFIFFLINSSNCDNTIGKFKEKVEKYFMEGYKDNQTCIIMNSPEIIVKATNIKNIIQSNINSTSGTSAIFYLTNKVEIIFDLVIELLKQKITLEYKNQNAHYLIPMITFKQLNFSEGIQYRTELSTVKEIYTNIRDFSNFGIIQREIEKIPLDSFITAFNYTLLSFINSFVNEEIYSIYERHFVLSLGELVSQGDILVENIDIPKKQLKYIKILSYTYSHLYSVMLSDVRILFKGIDINGVEGYIYVYFNRINISKASLSYGSSSKLYLTIGFEGWVDKDELIYKIRYVLKDAYDNFPWE